MEAAFEDAMVEQFDRFIDVCAGLPDPNDAHVVAAALKARATMIVTDNLKHFPSDALSLVDIEVRSSDVFLADLVSTDGSRAVASIRRMRQRLKRPGKTADDLLRDVETTGLTETAAGLRPHVRLL